MLVWPSRQRKRFRREITPTDATKDTLNRRNKVGIIQKVIYCHKCNLPGIELFDLTVIERLEQNLAEIPKGRRKNPEIKDFKKLNKVVLAEGGTNAAANHALRANHDLKLAQKTGKTRQGGLS